MESLVSKIAIKHIQGLSGNRDQIRNIIAAAIREALEEVAKKMDIWAEVGDSKDFEQAARLIRSEVEK